MKKWQSKEEFKARVREWAKKIDVDVRVISIRVMKNKWASFAVGSRLLIFNADLLKMDKQLGDYVIVHELLHFAVPNHGRLWKSLMRAHLGDYEAFEDKLMRKELEFYGVRPR
ncbi:MAG: M48 family metallopeptidase [Deltaproteobacteria bacterium]|nr:M48 family metallopeptidase [Deltaproteobacteria bacterium]